MKTATKILLLSAALTLGACSGTKEKLGLTKHAPDEFQVIKHAPLSLPPDYNLRPPRPGAPRPQEQSTINQARQTVTGQAASPAPAAAGISKGEYLLLQKAGATRYDPDIRPKVDTEAAQTEGSKTPVIKRILNLGGKAEPSSTVVDAPKEMERLKNNNKAAQTPSVEK